MKLGRVTGKVWATKKDPRLQSTTLYLIQPIDEDQKPLGGELVAVDTVGSGEGDIIYWVSGAEATFAFNDRQIPSDVTIVGIVDSINLAKKG
ncbi:MAG: EutN/CcmL family microcompartment protein [bacterium]